MSAKDLRIQPINSRDAARFVKRYHYSGKVVNNSQLHLGVFWEGRLEGVLQFGPSMDKRKTIRLVEGTGWNEFIEINRIAFTEKLPRNSESRAIGVALRLLKKHYPHIKWVISFADGTQCGDGTIYRASGFVLTGIRENTTIYEMPGGETFTNIGWRTGNVRQKIYAKYGRPASDRGGASTRPAEDLGARKKTGYQLRYIYFIDKAARGRLTVPEIPYSKIEEMGIGMYKGQRRKK